MTQSAEINTEQRAQSNRKLRFRLILAGTVVVLIAALILTPPYVNVNRYRRRITTTISQSLGRPVHLDNVTLHLLPVPGLTLSNLVVSEDPAFGYEPVIRANTVEATLRAGSLWRRQVEFSTIRFIDPSVNLVRSTEGKWNLESVLMQASRVEAAPTAQSTAGPAPRFPYIEATGARVNIKIGTEKKPFSLTEAQFALWLPSPQQWRVRMQGRPTRTDSNVSQAGEMNLEGSLQHAASMSDVPLDLRVTWNDAPLGEASRLLTGKDAGWRGTGFAEAHVSGRVSQAALTTHLQLNDLRRADFVPPQPLDITVDCKSFGDVAKATLNNITCAIPVGETKPITLIAPTVDLEKPKASEASISANALPLNWVLGWAKLFVAQIPATLEPAGTVDGDLKWNDVAAGWQGLLTAKLPATKAVGAGTVVTDEPPTFAFTVDTAEPKTVGQSQAPTVRFASTVLHPAATSSVSLSGQADSNAYTLHLSGIATASQVEALAAELPPLNEGVQGAFAKAQTGVEAHPVGVDCVRVWGGAQTCAMASMPAITKPSRPKHHR